MGHLDQTIHNSLKGRVCAALSAAESVDADSVRSQTLRLVKCAMDDRDMQAREGGDCAGCADEDIIALLTTMVAQREASSADYDAQGRITDAEREREEIEILSEFLPQPLAGDALKNAVHDVVQTLGASKLTDVGKCMTALRARYPGQIECSEAGKAVRTALS